MAKNSSYAKEFAKLNPQQKKAVDTIDGPLLVVAGPGTGKTQLLSMRVANILQKSDAKPDNILCLTFTNKAAINMQERLAGLAGPEGQTVVVKTFHSFAAEIMNIYPEYFWNGARLTVAPEAVQLDIIENILDSLSVNNPMAAKFAGSFTATGDVMQGLKLAKEAGLSPDKLSALINANVAYIDLIEQDLAKALEPRLTKNQLPILQAAVSNLPEQLDDRLVTPMLSLKSVLQESLGNAIQLDEQTGKSSETSKWKSKYIQTVDGKRGMFNERRRNEWWLELANVYRAYRQSMHERGYYDYSDMLVEVITQMETHSDLRAAVQERFLYVLIDEFQDTNAAQLRIAHLASDHHAANGRPNIMAVGDDDQSIFKFNGAELNNMLHFRRSYPASELIVLEQNYRSSQAILDTSQRIINQAQDRLVRREDGITKNLKAVASVKNFKGVIEHWKFQTREEQQHGLAVDIKKSWSRGEEVAILARSHESLVQLSARLMDAGVPIDYEQRKDILKNEAVEHLVLLAKILQAIRDGDEDIVNASLHRLLRHKMWKISARQLWSLAIENRRDPHWLESLLQNKDKNMAKTSEWMLELANEADRQPFAVILEYLLGLREYNGFVSPLKEYFNRTKVINNQYLETLSALRLLRNLANEFSHQGSAKLDDFLRFVEININNNNVIADESPFVSAKDPVKLLTIHKAKGLEFDTVYIIDVTQKEWEPRVAGRRKPPVNLPLQPYGEDNDDYVRLFYVAATRARRNFIATSYCLDDTNKEVLPALILTNAIPPIEKNLPTNNKPAIKILEDSLTWPRIKSSESKLLLRKQLDEYSLSVTHLLGFLDVTRGGPQLFFERNILKLPDVKTPSQAYGTAMHAALQQALTDKNLGKFSLGKTIKAFQDALKSEQPDKSSFIQYSQKGGETLERLFNDLNLDLPKGSRAEQRLSRVALGDARLNGAFDRVDLTGDDSIVIVDYKTGKPLPNLSTTNKTLEVKAWNHRTQLVFYALLARSSYRFKRARNVSCQMIYLEAENNRDLIKKYTPTKDEIDRLEKLIQAVWQRIINLDLPDTSGYSQDYKGITSFENDLLGKKP